MSGVLRILLLVPPLALSFHVHARLSDLIFLSLIFSAGLNRRPEKSPLYVGHESVGMGGWANALAAKAKAAMRRACRVITVLLYAWRWKEKWRSTVTGPADSQSGGRLAVKGAWVSDTIEVNVGKWKDVIAEMLE